MSRRDDLESIVGRENIVRSDPEALEPYIKDMGDFSSEPLVVVKPNSVDQVSKIVSYARKEKIGVVARGAGTSLTGASSSHDSIVIDFSRNMNHILRIDTVNWYVHCEAGVVIEDLNNALKKQGFFFPPDPASSSWCTIGGAIAENSGGMRCFHYGTMKDWVLALKVVLSDGSIVKLGEPLPKNRVGYDFVHLICGSEGTLALIGEAWLKIIPLPQGIPSVRLLACFEEWNKAVDAIKEIRAMRLEPILLEFIDMETAKAVNSAFELGIPEYEATLFIEIDSLSLDKLLQIIRNEGADSVHVAKDEADGERLYSARALAYLAVKSLGFATHTEDVVVPIDKLGEYLEFVKKTSEKYNLKIPTNGHAGDGNVHPVILYDQSSSDSIQYSKIAFGEICKYAIRVGGSVTGEHGIGEQKIEYANTQLVEHNGEQVIRIMKEVKRIWDPENIFNPGKFLKV